MTSAWGGSRDPIEDLRAFREDPNRHRGLAHYEHDGWTISLPDAPRRSELRDFLIRHFGREFADRMAHLEDADRFRGEAVRQRIEHAPHIHWAGPADPDLFLQRLRERLEKTDSWATRGEVLPPIGRRVTPAEARQIREDVAEEFRGWSGL